MRCRPTCSADDEAAAGVAQRPFRIHSAWRRWRCGAAQAVAIPLLVLIKMAQWLAPFFTYHFFTGDENDSVWFAVAMSVLAFAIATLAREFAIAQGPANGWSPSTRPDATRCGDGLLPLVVCRPAGGGDAHRDDHRFLAAPAVAACTGRESGP